MIQKLQLNPAQQTGVILQAKNKVDIWGRGTGKSAGIAWDINLINRSMPRALTSVTGQTFGQLLTRTLPSTFKLLELMGYKQHVSAKDPGNYIINRRPPDHFITPHEIRQLHQFLERERFVTTITRPGGIFPGTIR